MGTVNYTFDVSPLYVYLKKHYCLKCSSRLKVKYTSKVINPKSPEARLSDSSIGNIHYFGKSEIKKGVFYCPNCGFEISFLDMESIEEKRKRRKR